ncbi:MAG: hypothetical protein HOB49_10110, partial [Gemmatimonadetes bacterium]|nr:hypothetical protein [Gemmatimonadota bacterium]
ALDAIIRGGLALHEAQDEKGMWMFRKKDYSEWGPIRMPWAYSRWMRAFAIVGDAMPAAAHDKWSEGLRLGYGGIAAEELGRIHNIPAHHAMGLYCAGQVFEREGWCEQAATFLRQVAASQSPHGWWAEHDGPVVAYNFVYADALGAYYSMSADALVLPALEQAATYHATFTYPDGSCVETIDGRNPYHDGIRLGNAGLTRSAAGRGWTAQQHRLYLAQDQRFDADYAASMLAYAESGDAETPPGARTIHTQRMGEQALTRRRAPWFACLSAYTVDIPQNRWGQDRQSFVSLYHDTAGLIAGGGNTKLQPLWSTFTLGDTSLLQHVPGEEEPDFSAVDGLVHCPQSATLGSDDESVSVILDYTQGIHGRVELALEDESATIIFSAVGDLEMQVAAHLTLLPHLGTAISWNDTDVILSEESIDQPIASATTISHAGWQMICPAGSRLRWPVLPHNPYRKDGHATIEEARVVLTMPLTKDTPTSVEFRVPR